MTMSWNTLVNRHKSSFHFYINDDVKYVLRIGSAHNKGGPAGINNAQIFRIFRTFLK